MTGTNGKSVGQMMPVFVNDKGERFVLPCGSFIANGVSAARELGERANEICTLGLMFTGEVTHCLIMGKAGRIASCLAIILSEED